MISEQDSETRLPEREGSRAFMHECILHIAIIICIKTVLVERATTFFFISIEHRY